MKDKQTFGFDSKHQVSQALRCLLHRFFSSGIKPSEGAWLHKVL